MSERALTPRSAGSPPLTTGTVLWRPLHCARNALFGVLLCAGYLVLNQTVEALLGTDGFSCLFALGFPLGAAVLGWRWPTGAPGASLAVVAVLVATFDPDAGPTARSLTLGFSFVLAVATLLAESLAAIRSQVRARRAAPVPVPD